MDKMNNITLAEKIDWEGGILDTIEYGITSDDIEDETIADLWGEVEDLYNKIQPLLIKIEALLDDVT